MGCVAGFNRQNEVDKSVSDVTETFMLLPSLHGEKRPATLARILDSATSWLPAFGTSGVAKPEWLSAVSWPQLDERRRLLLRAEEHLTEAEQSRDSLRDSLEDEAGWQRLLWESGDPLQDAVTESLVTLGIDARIPTSKDDADLLIDTTSMRIVIEITGTQGAVDRDKIRQLRDWVDKHIDELADEASLRSVRGVLIANPFRLTPPDQRGAPFTEAAVRTAVDRGFVLCQTADLFRLVTGSMSDGHTAAWTLLGGQPG